jgi:hypothetical protein
MRLYLINRFAHNRWSLCVDIDEFFDFPYSDRIDMTSLLSYLNINAYTAVITQMLDMYPEYVKSQSITSHAKSLSQQTEYYDIMDVHKEPYTRHFGRSNTISNADIGVFFGGVRKRVFGLHRVLLTKHSLVFNDGKTQPLIKKIHRFSPRQSVHSVADAKLADISCVFYHYKINERLQEISEKRVHQKSFYKGSLEYKHYLNTLKKQKAILLRTINSEKIQSVNELIDKGYLEVTESYSNWTKKRPTGRMMSV